MKGLVKTVSKEIAERRQLRRPSALHIATADRLSQLNIAHWRTLTNGQSFFHSAEYLRGLEDFRPANIEPRYALISSADKPLATVYMQIASMNLRDVGRPTRKRKLEGLRARIQQRVLVCGNLLAYGIHGVCFAEGVSRAELWPAVTEVLYRVRRAEKLAGNTDLVLIKDLNEAELAESSALKKLSYGSVPTEPNMVLTLDRSWRSHEDYLKSLTSKFRSDIKNRVFKKFDDAGCVLEELSDVTTHAERLQELYLQVHGNAKLRPFTLSAAYWSGMAAIGGQNLTVHVARRGGNLIGFILSLKDGETAVAYHIGFDREAAESGIPLYLRLLHASLAQGIAFGCRRISFGRTALEPKARMGCAPEPTYVWARHRNPMVNKAVQPLLQLIEPAAAPQLSPFKASQDKG